MNISTKGYSRIKKLTTLLKGKNNLLIVMQDNPDPDSIASAVGLGKIAKETGNVSCSITHGGTIGRSENRALVQYLDLNLYPIEKIDFSKFDLIAMVDTQPGTGNNSLPENMSADIVFDHHPLRPATQRVQFHDIRKNYGATATIILEYLLAANITPDSQLATALLYAIRSDTQDLGREASQADIEAVGLLFPLANKRMLSEIEKGSEPREYFQILFNGLKNAVIYGNCVISKLGEVDNPDMIAEVADLLVRDDAINWTMCSGIAQGKLLISLRTQQKDARANKIIKKVVGREGSGGGHYTFAGGQIPLKTQTISERDRLERLIRRRFIKAVGKDVQDWESLVQP